MHTYIKLKRFKHQLRRLDWSTKVIIAQKVVTYVTDQYITFYTMARPTGLIGHFEYSIHK